MAALGSGVEAPEINLSYLDGRKFSLAEARVRRFAGNPALEGKRVPQVPVHQGFLRLRGAPASWITGWIQAEGQSVQFDDDQNLLPLAGFVTMDERPGRDPRASTVRPEDATPRNRGTFTASKRRGAGRDRHRNASSLSHGRHVRG